MSTPDQIKRWSVGLPHSTLRFLDSAKPHIFFAGGFWRVTLTPGVVQNGTAKYRQIQRGLWYKAHDAITLLNQKPRKLRIPT